MVGQVTNWIEPQTAWVIKVDSFGCDTPDCQTVGISESQHYSRKSIFIYPNPAKTEIQIDILFLFNHGNSILIYDMFGRKQDEIDIPARQTQVRVNVLNYPRGVYVAILKSENNVIGRGKFIKR